MATTKPVLKHSEIVFMYAADNEAYRAYGATFVGWGGAHTPPQVKRHHDLGIRCTGQMWCLTAGAKLLHEDAELRAAVAVDIEGKPVAVPWLFDKTYKGMKTYFGCTNSPAFRAHNRSQVRAAMSGGADGLHVDDHLGTASAAWYFGGGFCDNCMAAFRKYLKKNATPDQLRAGGVKDLRTFDYRELVRKHAKTRTQYMKVRNKVPLTKQFLQFQIEAAAENVRQLGRLAAEVAGHPVLLSANAFAASGPHRFILKHVTHVICEVPQHAEDGTKNPRTAIEGYNAATEAGRPLAATAGGDDWAYVKVHKCEDLVRFWIALAYAHGQRFMVPHPTRQWCFTKKLGTHWYQAPIEAYAPVYRFIKANADCFDGLEAVKVAGFRSPGDTVCTIRRKGRSGRTVIHVLNRDYDSRQKRMRARRNVKIRVPKALAGGSAKRVKLLGYDAKPQTVELKIENDKAVLELPALRLWTIVVLK